MFGEEARDEKFDVGHRKRFEELFDRKWREQNRIVQRTDEREMCEKGTIGENEGNAHKVCSMLFTFAGRQLPDDR